MDLKIIKMHSDMTSPSYAHKGDAGLDLRSAEDLIIKVGEIKNIKTGLKIELSEGYVGLVWDKSGRAAKDGLHCMSGVLDSGFRGEIALTIKNLGNKDFEVKRDMKIAQMLIQPVVTPNIVEVDSLDESVRGEGMWGSTGDF
ncbi:dUTP diphosphatase [Patescibacteria group bacterium]|nr:dUTP diphosphatase [Patescibacteria group bacterium]